MRPSSPGITTIQISSFRNQPHTATGAMDTPRKVLATPSWSNPASGQDGQWPGWVVKGTVLGSTPTPLVYAFSFFAPTFLPMPPSSLRLG